MNYIWEYWKALSLKGAGGIGWGIGLGVLEHSGFVTELKNSSFLSSLSPGSDKYVVDINERGYKVRNYQTLMISILHFLFLWLKLTSL